MTGILGRVRNYVGEGIITVGALHTLAAWSSYADEWSAIRDGGYWGTVKIADTGHYAEALWFAVAGVSYVFTGILVRAHIRATGTLPMSFAVGTTAVALAICVAMPASGAWLALACGLWAVLVAAGDQPAVAEAPVPRSNPRFGPEDLMV